MISLKKQQRKLLAQEITSKIMECLMGLNEKNETAMQKTIRKYSRRIVKTYSGAIKQQHKKIRSTVIAEEQPIQTIFEETTNVIAS